MAKPDRLSWSVPLDRCTKPMSGRSAGGSATVARRFWLQGAFTVSALEQVAFLDRLLSGSLPVSPASVTTLREAMVLEAGPGYRWMGKTGWAGFGDFARPGVGWLVGWVERDGKRWIHAMNADIHDPSDAAKRLEITRAVLGELGLLGEKDQGGATF